MIRLIIFGVIFFSSFSFSDESCQNVSNCLDKKASTDMQNIVSKVTEEAKKTFPIDCNERIKIIKDDENRGGLVTDEFQLQWGGDTMYLCKPMNKDCRNLFLSGFGEPTQENVSCKEDITSLKTDNGETVSFSSKAKFSELVLKIDLYGQIKYLKARSEIKKLQAELTKNISNEAKTEEIKNKINEHNNVMYEFNGKKFNGVDGRIKYICGDEKADLEKCIEKKVVEVNKV